MSLLDSLYDHQVWTQFLNYKRFHGSLTVKELEQLELFISQKRYLPVAKTLCFSVPQKKAVNKSGSHKKRIIYTFPADETWVLKLLTWLLYKYDSAFHKSCYSFRQNSTAKAAMNDLLRTPGIDEKWVLKLDIHNYFNSMPSELLARELSQVITDDEPLLDFLTELFTLDKAVCGERVISENTGAMAGVPLSAFCANIYLSDLDRQFEQMGVPYFRYSDDILVLADSEQQAREYYSLIKKHAESKGLTLNDEKYSLSSPGEAWEFLGFKYYHGEVDLADATVRKMKGKIKRKAAMYYRHKNKKHLYCDKAAQAMIKTFNCKYFDSFGDKDFTWSRWFFPVLTTDKGLHELDSYLLGYIRFIYTGRHYKGNYRISYEHIRSLGFRSLVNEFYKFRKKKN